jgi:hypothetical protein
MANEIADEPVSGTLLVAVIELRGAISELTQAVRDLTGRFEHIEQQIDGVERRFNQRIDDVEQQLNRVALRVRGFKIGLWFMWILLLPILAATTAITLKVWNVIGH